VKQLGDAMAVSAQNPSILNEDPGLEAVGASPYHHTMGATIPEPRAQWCSGFLIPSGPEARA
jgi:hypothetical protein